MPKTEEPEDKQVSLSLSQLKDLLSAAKTQNNDALIADGFAKLAEALRDSKVPYEDPRKKETELLMRESSRENEGKKQRSIEWNQRNCPHLQGSSPNSVRAGTESSFIIHTLDTNERIGLCTNCGKEISSLNPNHGSFFSMKSGNSPSEAGRRFFYDPLNAMLARYGKAERAQMMSKVGDGNSY